MSGVNKWIGIGRLGRSPEMRYTKSGDAVCNFSLAVQERKDQPTTWVNIVAWRKLAEIMAEYLNKGSQVYIEGRLQIREYEDKDGNKRQTTEIVASNMTMLGQNQTGTSSEREPYRSENNQEGFEEDEDPEIPF